MKIFKRKKITRSIWGNMTAFSLLCLGGLFMVLPLVYTVVNAFKPLNELFLFPPRFFAQHPTLDNFTMMFSLASNLWVPFLRYLFNSVFVASFGTVTYIIIASLAAYPLAKFKFPGSVVFFQLVVWAILFRTEVTAVPTYVILSGTGMINTYFALIIPALSSTFGVFLMRQFMTTIPFQIIEAARIDGAGEYHIFWNIVMPSVKPGWITLIIFAFQGFWNATGINYIYDETLKGLPAVLSQIATAGIARAGAGSAVALFLMTPPIIIFVISQSSILETMAHSGIKGE
jgi:putative chitobiose transport system permease protein